MGPGDLSAAVKNLFNHIPVNPHVLVGFGTLDDAGVYCLSDTQALVQTVDFITPVVDDPFAYGEIAIANALSDVWAMGGKPITALNIACFPSGLDPQILHEILRGGLSKLQEAGVALLGGHTVDDPEIKYGASVTGLVAPDRILSNAGAQAGDVLVLTKPLGTGIISTGLKHGAASAEAVLAATESMRALNKSACEIMLRHGAHACTDVTGFGLAGHLSHLARESQVTARVTAAALPLLPQALALCRQGVTPGGLSRNQAYFSDKMVISLDVEPSVHFLLFDPQTSGGLLIALPGNRGIEFLQELHKAGLAAAVIGEIIGSSRSLIQVI